MIKTIMCTVCRKYQDSIETTFGLVIIGGIIALTREVFSLRKQLNEKEKEIKSTQLLNASLLKQITYKKNNIQYIIPSDDTHD